MRRIMTCLNWMIVFKHGGGLELEMYTARCCYGVLGGQTKQLKVDPNVRKRPLPGCTP